MDQVRYSYKINYKKLKPNQVFESRSKVLKLACVFKMVGYI